MSAGQKAVHARSPAKTTAAGMPRIGERFSSGELASRFGVQSRGDVRVNHAGKCIVLVDRTGGGSSRACGGDRAAFLYKAAAAGGQAGRDGGLHGDNLVLSRSREEGYTVLYFRKVGRMLEFASRVEYESHAPKDEARKGRTRSGILFRLRAVDGSASGAARGPAPPRAVPDPDMVERVERVVSANRRYESKDRLLMVLPGRVTAADLDRVLDHLVRSAKVAMEEGAVLWASKADGSGRASRGRRSGGAGKSILAGTRFEAIEEGKSPTETTGEYIARLVNADEPGTYTAEDAREIDEDMRCLAKGEYYTHEQMLKELGL